MSEPRPKKRRRPARKRKTPTPGADPPEPEIRSSAGKWALVVALAVIGLAAGALLFVYPLAHGPGVGRRDVVVILPGGESPEALAERLTAAGLVAHPRLFAVYLRLTGGAEAAVKGEHFLTDDLSPRELVARLERSPYASHTKITIPEGWTRFDIARRLQLGRVCSQRAFLDATVDPELLAELRLDADPGGAVAPSVEGYLFPATYDLAEDADARDVVRRMKTEFDRRWAAAEARHASSVLSLGQSLGWGVREIVTLASMVEKEAAVDDERALIASVFVNRLREPTFTPKLLQCDPTAGYGCLVMPAQIPSCAAYTGKITHDIVADAANPYNTYKHEGLPPGPIANPGTKSLEAAMAPAVTKWLYFVAKGDGHSAFSETYGQHAAAVRGQPAAKP
jgi:UPF0755 protein